MTLWNRICYPVAGIAIALILLVMYLLVAWVEGLPVGSGR